MEAMIEPRAPLLGSDTVLGLLEKVEIGLGAAEESAFAVELVLLARAEAADPDAVAVAVAEKAKLEASEVCVQSSSKLVLCPAASIVVEGACSLLLAEWDPPGPSAMIVAESAPYWGLAVDPSVQVEEAFCRLCVDGND